MHTCQTIVCMFTLSLCVVSGDRECTTINFLHNYKLGHYFANATSYLNFKYSFPVKCVETCMKSSVCKSVNFNTSSGECQLYHQSSVEFNIIGDTDFILTDVKDWPFNIAGDCSNHTCPNNTICVPDPTKIYSCIVVGCLWTSDLENVLPSNQPMWEFGIKHDVVCKDEYYTTEKAVCTSVGNWAIPACRRYATNCRMVKRCNESYGDGEYWVYKSEAPGKTKLMKIYCYNMTSTKPLEFVTLTRYNFATRSAFKYENHQNCTKVQWDNSKIDSKKLGETIFYKVGLKLNMMDLYETVYTFANSTTPYFVSYGSGYSCSDSVNSSCPGLGRFMIDLRNTSFVVSSGTTWSKDLSQTTYIQNISFSKDNLIVEGRCGGNCGGCSVDNLGVEINDDFQPDMNSAVLPMCD